MPFDEIKMSRYVGGTHEKDIKFQLVHTFVRLALTCPYVCSCNRV
jgi:hypothetical protein